MLETKKVVVLIAKMLAAAGVDVNAKSVEKEMTALNDALEVDDPKAGGDDEDDEDEDEPAPKKRGRPAKAKAAPAKGKKGKPSDDDDEDDDDEDDEDEDDEEDEPAPYNAKKLASYSRDQLLAYAKAKKVTTTGLKMGALRTAVEAAYKKGKAKGGR